MRERKSRRPPNAGGPNAHRPRSVRARTTLAAVVLVLAALVIGSAAFVVVLRLVLVDGVRASAESGLEQASARVEADGASAVDGYDEVLVQVVGEGGQVIAHGDDADPPALPTADESRYDHDGERWLLVADDVDLPGGSEATVVFGASLDAADTATTAVTTLLAVGVPVLVTLMGIGTWIVVGRSLRPVERIRREVADVGGASRGARVLVPDTGDEVARLAATMNDMLDRLERSAAAQRRFVSDASHELRSPIASVRQHASVARAHPDRMEMTELTDVVLAENDRLAALVDGLLELSRLDERGIGERRPVDLDDIVLAEVARIRSAGVVRVDGSGIGAARVLGDERVLGRVVRNLIDNAARHASTGIAVGVRAVGGTAELVVDDDGAGVPPEDRQRVFDRFVRLDEARARDDGGSGLGLAIVRDAVVAHGGTVTVEDAPTGGARFVVRIALGG
ncbi:HAMP domain-containing sensor histidine kinase [Curtobacterium sp. PhB136]|uniref:sensor histidine kinase n=1 Tax=Curtobacterium sp. PhB136 TaxID=2485181 RepID=UPI0010476EC7|nr:HAMP domain-containing sensor histidine kinase [Curtobacterium sp. PhB136]TCK59754.1 signal transduction histidine kinase [Curtobacterium sp. PhB136]